MAEYIVTYLEVDSIQDYIFSSNDLAQHIGASELVNQTVGDWIFKTLETLKISSNAESLPKQPGCNVPSWKITDTSIANGNLGGEIIYAGGGKAALLFSNDDNRRRFTRQLSLNVLQESPGLQLNVRSQKINWDQKDALKDTLNQLRRMPSMRQHSAPLLGLGVTAACDFTALPVYKQHTEPDRTTQLISKVVSCKLDAAEKTGKERLHCLLPQVREKGFEFIYDFDLFGTLNESSYIAVIHADGNGMGNRFANITGATNADYVKEIRKFSSEIKRISELALKMTVDQLIASTLTSFKGEMEVKPHPKDKKRYLPFRPIVFGGDDVTFVADGRLGLSLTAKYLDILRSPTPEFLLPDGKPLYTRAGVAVVKTHYPFSRAYQMASDLGNQAKQILVKGVDTAMDWHFSTTGAVFEIEKIRQRDYVARDGRNLLSRPISIGTSAWPSWAAFQKVTDDFKNGEKWSGRRNKVKALREALRAGELAVEQFRTNFSISLDEMPKIDDMPQAQTRGWDSNRCAYFDAIEATDFFVQL